MSSPLGDSAAGGRVFTPASAIWAVNRELALLLGGGRALLLQIAHPLIAAGVQEHSAFGHDPFGRLARTLAPMYALVFGPGTASDTAAERLRRVHAPVRGVLREAVGPYPAGAAYDAADPALRLWVHATLIDTGLLVYSRFVRPLSPVAAARYYDDSRELARRVDVPAALVPPTLEAFRAYMAEQVAGDALAVGSAARGLARAIFRPPSAPALRPLGPMVELLTAGLLPAPVRDLYGYGWTPAREQALHAFATAVRLLLPLLPPRCRVAPAALRAERAETLTRSPKEAIR